MLHLIDSGEPFRCDALFLKAKLNNYGCRFSCRNGHVISNFSFNFTKYIDHSELQFKQVLNHLLQLEH